MTDLHPGMAIEVSTTYAVLSAAPDRPSWLHPSAMWPPEPGKVMYMVEERSKGICDRCILTCKDEIERFTGSSMLVRDRGRGTSWYCSCSPDGYSCDRWWDGYKYKRD